MTSITLFSFGYWGWGNAVPQLVEAIDAVEKSRGYAPPIFADVRISRAVRAAGFEYWTILKPVFLMYNFAEPKAIRMFPHLASGTILTALTPDCRPQMIAAEHVGAYALASLQLPERFNRRDVDLGEAGVAAGGGIEG